MDFKTFWKGRDAKGKEAFARNVGSTVGTCHQIAYGEKRVELGFADAEAAIKTLGAAETALDAAKSQGLAQVASVEEMTRTVALYAAQARTTRLMLEKLVKTRKESIRVEIVQSGKIAFAAHIDTLNKRLGKPYMPSIPADFAGVIKGKKTITSLQNAVDTELARAKIEANAIADRIGMNLNTLRELAKDVAFLFADTATIVQKAPDDLTALVHMRINEHRVAEQRRLDAERERIRAEEEAKARREAAAKYEAEQREAAKVQPTAQPTETAQPPLAVAQPTAPVASVVPKPVMTMKASGKVIPTDAAIVRAVALAFQTDDATARGWLCEIFGSRAA